MKSHFLFPGWWVELFELSLAIEEQDVTATDLAFMLKFTPALRVQELDALSLILVVLQEQILQAAPVLTLDPWKHRKYVSLTGQQRHFTFERVLQMIPGLRLLYPDGKGGFRSIPMFGNERWRPRDKKKTYVLEFEAEALTRELILGFADPYVDLRRSIAGEAEAATLLRDKPPLAIWRSVWLDLQGSEQLLLLRLEQAMQWEAKWLQLDGSFGSKLMRLIGGLLSKRGDPSFEQKRRALTRIGQKLVDHGLLQNQDEHDFLAFTDVDRGAHLVWRVSSQRLVNGEASAYQDSVMQHLFTNSFRQEFGGILQLLSGPLMDEPMRRQVSGILSSLADQRLEMIAILNGTHIVSSAALFLEWMIRQMPGHLCPLPEMIEKSAAGRLCMPQDQRPILERYAQFKDVIAGDSEYVHELKTLAGATFVSRASRSDPTYSKFLMAPRLTPRTNLETEAKQFDESLPKVHLKRLAAQRLQSLRQEHPSDYQRLKADYMKSLDLSKRQMLSDVQRKLQPQVFEDQLRHSLIKFMVENPELWDQAAAK